MPAANVKNQKLWNKQSLQDKIKPIYSIILQFTLLYYIHNMNTLTKVYKNLNATKVKMTDNTIQTQDDKILWNVTYKGRQNTYSAVYLLYTVK